MSAAPWRSLRLQVATLGFAAIYLPVLVVLGVGALTQEESVVVGADGSEVVARAGGGPSGWTLATVVALAPVAAALAWWWSGRAVLPLDRVRRVAEEIEATDLGRRVALDRGPTEAVALAGAFDALLDRLEGAAEVQRTLVEEASHELRTPLAVVLTSADVALAAPEPTVESQREALERVRSAAHRMRATVDALLVEARGRARTLARAAVDVAALARDVVAEAEPVAAAASVRLVVSVAAPGGGATATIDAPGVRRALADLIANAIRHAPAGTDVAVTVAADPERLTVTVTDQGPGIPEADRERAFERFWSGGDGTGLGLAIARQVARAHAGDVTLADPPSGPGLQVTLTLRR